MIASANPKYLKGAMKLYFMHHLCVIIIWFNTDLYKSAFPTYYFENLVFCLSALCIFSLFCFELDVYFIELQYLSNQCLCS